MKTLVRTLAALSAVGLALILIPASPAIGGDCENACDSKRSSCDNKCTEKELICKGMCGLPIAPGYADCTEKCRKDKNKCSDQCTIDNAACKVECKISGK